MDKKDLIIIGAGMNGLTAGIAYLMNCGNDKRKVLILEKNPIGGGYVTSFNRMGYAFDTCQMISNVSDILEYLGIPMEFEEFRNNFIRIFKADWETGQVKTIDLVSNREALEEKLIRLYPEDSAGIRRFFKYSYDLFMEIYGLKYQPRLPDILKMLFTCPKVIRNASKNFSEYFHGFHIRESELGLIFQVFSSFCGLPNSSIAALLTVGVMYSLLEKAYRPKGPFIDLPVMMEKRFVELGGEIVLKSEVEEILSENGRVKGVRLKDGGRVLSDHVITTVDVKAAMGRLAGEGTIRSLSAKYAGKVEKLQMTTSSFTVNLGLDDPEILSAKGLDCGYALLTSGNEAYQRLYQSFLENKQGLSEECFYIGLSCPRRSLKTKPVLSIQAVPMAVGNWVELRKNDMKLYRAEKERTADLLIGLVERYLLPGIRKHIVVKDISSPATFARYSGSPTGSIYDMAALTNNFGMQRLQMRTPIQGLLQPKFAHGVFGAMNSGLQAVDLLLKGKVLHGNSRFK